MQVRVSVKNDTALPQTLDFYLEGGTVTRVKGIAFDEVGKMKDVKAMWPQEMAPGEQRTGEVLFGYLRTDPPAERFVVIEPVDGETLFSEDL